MSPSDHDHADGRSARDEPDPGDELEVPAGVGAKLALTATPFALAVVVYLLIRTFL